MAVSSDGEFGRALVQALGLEGQEVYSIELRAAANEAVTMTVGRFVSADEIGLIAKVLENYELVKTDGA